MCVRVVPAPVPSTLLSFCLNRSGPCGAARRLIEVECLPHKRRGTRLNCSGEKKKKTSRGGDHHARKRGEGGKVEGKVRRRAAVH